MRMTSEWNKNQRKKNREVEVVLLRQHIGESVESCFSFVVEAGREQDFFFFLCCCCRAKQAREGRVT